MCQVYNHLKLEVQGLVDFLELAIVFVNPFADVKKLNDLVKTTIDHSGQVADLFIRVGLEFFGLILMSHSRRDSREKTRQDLLDYCKRDTWATVRVLERLRELAE